MYQKSALLLIIIASFFISGCSRATSLTETGLSGQAVPSKAATTAPVSVMPADSIEVVHFHGTQQCVSCITVGKLAKQTIEEKFPNEVKSGKIVFKEVNGELPENEAMVIKYQARGSSLFVNAIRGDQDNIAEDTTVWRLVNNESQFVSYFETKLKGLLGQKHGSVKLFDR